MSKELRPCPFCGGSPLLKQKAIGTRAGLHTEEWEISCVNCGAKPTSRYYLTEFTVDSQGELKYFKDGRTEAIEAWNRRVTDE